MASILKRFADRLRYLRLEKKLTQEALASKAKLATGFISDLERARKIPSLVTLGQLSHGLGMDISELLKFSDAHGEPDDRHSDELKLLMDTLRNLGPAELRRVRKVIESMQSAS